MGAIFLYKQLLFFHIYPYYFYNSKTRGKIIIVGVITIFMAIYFGIIVRNYIRMKHLTNNLLN